MSDPKKSKPFAEPPPEVPGVGVPAPEGLVNLQPVGSAGMDMQVGTRVIRTDELDVVVGFRRPGEYVGEVALCAMKNGTWAMNVATRGESKRMAVMIAISTAEPGGDRYTHSAEMLEAAAGVLKDAAEALQRVITHADGCPNCGGGHAHQKGS